MQFGDGDESLVISFRGTEQKVRDWLTDIDGFHTAYPYNNKNSKIQVHRGFIKAYRSIRGTIHQYIVQHKQEIKKIYVCGHSLGGALGTLCAVDMQYNFPFPVECYVSGSPRVGNKAFVKSFNKRVPVAVRTYMRTDIVPFLPPRWIEKYSKGGYKHIGLSNPIGPRRWLVGLYHLILSRFKTKKLAADLTNHSIRLYKHYLKDKKCCKQSGKD